MPPRISVLTWLRPNTTTNFPRFSPLRLFSSSPASNGSTTTQRRRGHDPYAIAQARARKAAHLSRRKALVKERAEALGDPVRGVTTPFVKSFDTGVSIPSSNESSDTAAKPVFNHFIRQEELEKSLKNSHAISMPIIRPSNAPSSSDDRAKKEPTDILDLWGEKKTQSKPPPMTEEEHRQSHIRAATAVARIVSLANGNSSDRLRVNIQRCIDTFGRHNTDQTLPPKPRSAATPEPPDGVVKQRLRAGPDTGSSEVQISILTAKIRALANVLETTGRRDKHNKRNLRVLVHKRQKLLQYLRRKERGGPRWQHLIEKLGLTQGTWKGEISL